MKQVPDSKKICVHSKMVDILSRVTPSMMKDAQEEDIDISKMICYVKYGKKPSLAQISKIKSRLVCRYLCQFNQLVFHQGVLQWVYEQDGAKYHQLSLGPKKWNCSIINRVIRQLSICYSWYKRDFIGALCFKMSELGLKCQQCQNAKRPYVDPNPAQESIIANNPMDLLCIDFMKVDLSKDRKEKVLVMTDTFSKFSVTVVMPNQQAKTVAKALVDKWFYT